MYDGRSFAGVAVSVRPRPRGGDRPEHRLSEQRLATVPQQQRRVAADPLAALTDAGGRLEQRRARQGWRLDLSRASRSMVSPGRSCSTLVGVVVMPIKYDRPPDENAPGSVVFATFTVDPVVPVTVT